MWFYEWRKFSDGGSKVFEALWSIEFAALVHISDIYWSLVQLHLETLTLETPNTK